MKEYENCVVTNYYKLGWWDDVFCTDKFHAACQGKIFEYFAFELISLINSSTNTSSIYYIIKLCVFVGRARDTLSIP